MGGTLTGATNQITIISEPERTDLYTKIRHLLGAPLRAVEIEDEQMDSLLEFAIGDYSQYIQEWLIESQWTSLYNLNLDTHSLSKAFITRSLDYEDRYTYAYSKIVGLQTGGDWVLKKDYIQLVSGQQIYEIPANREMNELLWFTPAELTNLLFDPWSFGALGGVGLGGPGGFSQMGNSGSYFMMPAFDMLLRMQEMNIQRRIIAGDLTYRTTALPGGKKAIHLMNTPGGKFDFGNATLMRGKVWYWYYDTEGSDRDKCLRDNPDIIKLPSDVPIDAISWNDLNHPAKQWVRRWFVAYVKETLSRVRGKFSGNIKTPDSELTMDYASLSTEAKDEKSKLIEELIGAEGRLTRLRPEKVMEREALLAENLNKQLKFRAMPRQIYVI
jgi:hypothetical protein